MKHISSTTATVAGFTGPPVHYLTVGEEYTVSLLLNCNSRTKQWPRA